MGAGSSATIGLEADAEPGSRSLGKALQGPGRGLPAPAFEACDDCLGGAHGLGHMRLRHPGPAACFDQGRGEGELRLQGLVLGAKVRVIQPLPDDVPRGDAPTAYASSSCGTQEGKHTIDGQYCTFAILSPEGGDIGRALRLPA